MPSATVENYLKHAYLLQQEQPGPRSRVAMGRLAAAVGVTPGTATSMVKALADANLVDHAPRGGIWLTPAGTRLARQVLRRHRLIEQFLVEVLKMDWAEVHAEAEELEHAVSDKVLERIDALLGHPATDPHGDPIPRGDAKHDDVCQTWSLCDCPLNQPVSVARVLDQTPAFLQYLDRHGLTPGAAVSVAARDEPSDAVTVRSEGKRAITLGLGAAKKILVSDR